MTVSAPSLQHRGASRHHARGFWLIAYVFAITLAAAGAPTPLYVLYQQEQGFGSFVLTIIFAVYAVGVALSLYLAGHLSDKFGRRRILAPAVLLNVLALLIFLSTHDLGWVLVARFIAGLGIGMLTATATAHLSELHRTARPDAAPTLATAVGTIANLLGIGLGPLIAGFIADFLPDPLFTPYMVFAFLTVVALLGLVLVPETVDAIEWRYRPQKIAVPDEARSAFWAAGAVSFVGFAVFGFFNSLAPSFLVTNLHENSRSASGLLAFLVFGTGALAQALTVRWKSARLYSVGLSVMPVGITLVVAAILTSSLWLILGAGTIVGIGAGLACRGAITAVIEAAPPAARAEALAGLFLISYLGMAGPVVLLGLLLQFAPTGPSAVAFGALMLVLVALSSVMIGIARRNRTRRI